MTDGPAANSQLDRDKTDDEVRAERQRDVARAQRDLLGGHVSSLAQRFYALQVAFGQLTLDQATAYVRREIEGLEQGCAAIAQSAGLEA